MALVRDGDTIRLDMRTRTLGLLVDADERCPPGAGGPALRPMTAPTEPRRTRRFRPACQARNTVRDTAPHVVVVRCTPAHIHQV
jgi:dihydroxyacid dehydratase/phosphogluconate dehydratase